MKKYGVIIGIILCAASLKGYIDPLQPEAQLPGVYSFRLRSTGFMFEDVVDIMQNPVRLTTIGSPFLMTALSNIYANERLFWGLSNNNLVFGGGYMKGKGAEAGLISTSNQRNLLPNLLGSNGFVSVDSLYREDTDGDNVPDRETSISQEEDAYTTNNTLNGLLSFGVNFDSYTLGFLFGKVSTSYYEVDPGNIAAPLGYFNYTASVRNIITGDLLQTTDGSGTGSTSNKTNTGFLGIAGRFQPFEDGHLTGLLTYRTSSNKHSNNYDYSILYDYSPQNADVNTRADSGQTADINNANPSEFTGLLVYEKAWNAQNKSVFYLGGSMSSISNDEGFNMNETFTFITNDLANGTAMNDIVTQTGTQVDPYTGKEKGFLIGDRNSFAFNRGIVGFGAVLSMRSTDVSAHAHYIDSTYTHFNDGDNQPNDPDDFDSYTFTKWDYDSMTNSVSYVVNIPVGVEIYPLKKKNMALRLGAMHSITYNEAKTTINTVSYTPRTTITDRGDGTHTVNVQDASMGSTSNTPKTLTSTTVFSYGAGFMIGSAFQIDLMGFSNLTNMNNWNISVIFHF